MKKGFFGLLITIIVTLAADYLLIPNFITLKAETTINVTQPGLHRMLLTNSNVSKWWPGKVTDSGTYIFKGNQFAISNNNISLLPVKIITAEKTILSSLYLISHTIDSLQLTWVANTVTSYNPLKRFLLWRNAKKIEADMNVIASTMKQFYSKPENIYGITVEKTLVADSVLITTGAYNKGYPDSRFVYTLINKLRNYAAAKNAKATGYPMLNIETADSINYNVRVALPLNKVIPGNGNDIGEKRMLGMGNILVAEVKGGIATVTEAFKQINIYARDYQRVPPAIPFFSLITDRTAEPDSSKWITKIYCPVM
jgi:hypothetical protein